MAIPKAGGDESFGIGLRYIAHDYNDGPICVIISTIEFSNILPGDFPDRILCAFHGMGIRKIDIQFFLEFLFRHGERLLLLRLDGRRYPLAFTAQYPLQGNQDGSRVHKDSSVRFLGLS